MTVRQSSPLPRPIIINPRRIKIYRRVCPRRARGRVSYGTLEELQTRSAFTSARIYARIYVRNARFPRALIDENMGRSTISHGVAKARITGRDVFMASSRSGSPGVSRVNVIYVHLNWVYIPGVYWLSRIDRLRSSDPMNPYLAGARDRREISRARAPPERTNQLDDDTSV